MKRRNQDKEDEKIRIQRQLAETNDPDQKKRLLEQLQLTEQKIKRELEDEKRNQDKVLEERRKRKADRMAIRKMRIEHDQLEDVLAKELNINNTKFKAQLDQMTETSNELMNQQIKEYLQPEHTNKE